MKPIDLISNIGELEKWSEISVNFYGGKQLTEYINGGAELYFAYNFKEACIKEYKNSFGSDLVLEIYEMDKSENAYGIYSFDTDGEHPQIGQEATYANGLLKFWKHRFFIRILYAGEDPNVKGVILSIGKEIAHRIRYNGVKPEILSRIPPTQVVSESLHYFHKNICLNNFYYLSDENILNLNDETEAVTFEYEIGKQLLRVILVQYSKPEDAKDAYSQFIRSYFFDRLIQDPKLSTNCEFIGKVEKGKYTGIRVSETFLIIAFEAEDEDSCRRILDSQANGLGN